MAEGPEIWFPNLGIEINHLSRVALSIFGFEIYYYAVFISLGMALGLCYALREAKRTGQDPDLYLDFFFCATFFSIIGARIYFIIFAGGNYLNNPLRIINIRAGGLAIYGGIIAAVITAYVFTKRRNIEFGLLADTAVPGLILGQAIGRIGNFFNREVFGSYTESLFAMRYLKSQVPDIPPSVLENIVVVNGLEYIQVQPTFLYEMVWNIGVFILLNLYKKKKKFNGELLMLYFIGYGIGRFFIEGIRTDQLILFNTGIPVNQLLSAILAAGATGFIVYKRVKLRKTD